MEGSRRERGGGIVIEGNRQRNIFPERQKPRRIQRIRSFLPYLRQTSDRHFFPNWRSKWLSKHSMHVNESFIRTVQCLEIYFNKVRKKNKLIESRNFIEKVFNFGRVGNAERKGIQIMYFRLRRMRNSNTCYFTSNHRTRAENVGYASSMCGQRKEWLSHSNCWPKPLITVITEK